MSFYAHRAVLIDWSEQHIMIKNRLTLPLVPLRGISVFPGMALHFDVARPRSIAAIRTAMEQDKLVFLCYQYDIDVESPQRRDLAKVGCIAEVKQILNMPDGNIRVLIEGLERGRITRFTDLMRYVEVNVTRIDDIMPEDTVENQLLIRRLFGLIEKFLGHFDRLSPESMTSLMSIDNPGELADVVIANFPIKPQLKQEILDEIVVADRIERLIEILSNEFEIMELEKEISNKVQANLDDNQRDYFLREKLRVIREELGDADGVEGDIGKYKKQMEEKALPEITVNKLNEELDRMRKTHPGSQEYGVIQTYIETVLALPWGVYTEDTFDMDRAEKILNRDHTGLDKVKERILEYIAVRKLNGNPKSNILCLVGPPGTGKTSIARSLAEALNRNYTRISLGGVHNEAEIRGHRKTYIGAMPGRVIDAIKYAKSANPLMLFDEIDKMSKDYSGDPGSAMLEVFDPEQNKTFRDHYIEMPFDLSQVIFIATANSLETVPKPLLDRMDVIEVSGYTVEEKLEIAKKHLIPKQRKAHGLSTSDVKLSPSVLPELIEGYTRESGVRSLERMIAKVCRKAAVNLAKKGEGLSLTKSNLEEVMGKRIFNYEKAPAYDQVGLVTGLAWTESGGDTLPVEVNIMPGSGKLELTGNLGDVMQESARAALSYVRSNTFKLDLPQDFYKNMDIHIHVPEGAVPKDGPSAGVTMATALVSALSGRAVDRFVAMTGEITLRGRVLPIGGLKEKALAAYRMGIKKVVIPYENRADYRELPEKLKKEMEFIFAQTIGQVLDVALLPLSKHSKEVKYIEQIMGTRDKVPVRVKG